MYTFNRLVLENRQNTCQPTEKVKINLIYVYLVLRQCDCMFVLISISLYHPNSWLILCSVLHMFISHFIQKCAIAFIPSSFSLENRFAEIDLGLECWYVWVPTSIPKAIILHYYQLQIRICTLITSDQLKIEWRTYVYFWKPTIIIIRKAQPTSEFYSNVFHWIHDIQFIWFCYRIINLVYEYQLKNRKLLPSPLKFTQLIQMRVTYKMGHLLVTILIHD